MSICFLDRVDVCVSIVGIDVLEMYKAGTHSLMCFRVPYRWEQDFAKKFGQDACWRLMSAIFFEKWFNIPREINRLA